MRGVSGLHPRNQTRDSAPAGGCKKYCFGEVGVGGYVKPVDERGREQAVDGGLLWHMVGRQMTDGMQVYAERRSMTRRSRDEMMMEGDEGDGDPEQGA